MNRFILAILLLLGTAPVPVLAQGVPDSSQVVATCGTPPATYTPGQNQPQLQNTNGLGCTNAVLTSPQGSLNVTTAQVSIGTSATQILTAFVATASKVVCNQGTTPVYLGNSGVTISTSGMVIGGTGNPPCWDFTHFPGSIYGVVAGGTNPVGYVYY